MLDQVLIKHLDKQENLEDEIDGDIEKLLAGVKIEDLIADAEGVLINITDDLFSILKEKYYHVASENGIKLAKDIIKDGDIKIQNSNDPNLNE